MQRRPKTDSETPTRPSVPCADVRDSGIRSRRNDSPESPSNLHTAAILPPPKPEPPNPFDSPTKPFRATLPPEPPPEVTPITASAPSEARAVEPPAGRQVPARAVEPPPRDPRFEAAAAETPRAPASTPIGELDFGDLDIGPTPRSALPAPDGRSFGGLPAESPTARGRTVGFPEEATTAPRRAAEIAPVRSGSVPTMRTPGARSSPAKPDSDLPPVFGGAGAREDSDLPPVFGGGARSGVDSDLPPVFGGASVREESDSPAAMFGGSARELAPTPRAGEPIPALPRNAGRGSSAREIASTPREPVAAHPRPVAPDPRAGERAARDARDIKDARDARVAREAAQGKPSAARPGPSQGAPSSRPPRPRLGGAVEEIVAPRRKDPRSED